MTDTEMDYGECTAAQRALLDKLPSGAEELADEFDITKSGVNSRINRIRKKGIKVPYDPDTEEYYVHGGTPDFDSSELNEGGDRIPEAEAVGRLNEDGLTYRDFKELYGVSQDVVVTFLDKLEQRGHTVEYKVADDYGTKLFYIEEDRGKRYRVEEGEGVYRFALISDTHLGSKAEHLSELHDFYDRLEDEGVEHVYHAGDISDGWKVHKGHINAIKGQAAGWDRLLDYVVENYPRRENISTFFIEGNHDRKYHRRNGIHFGALIARRRDDLHYCGDSQARFVFDQENDIDLELIHPSGGKPYTQGYRAQTLYRERPAEERPTLSGIGHLHGKLFTSAEDVDSFYAGCWKGLTTYGKRKGHDSQIGGWIVELEIEDGEIRRVSPDWVGYESRDESKEFSADDIDEMVDG